MLRLSTEKTKELPHEFMEERIYIYRIEFMEDRTVSKVKQVRIKCRHPFKLLQLNVTWWPNQK